MSKNQRTKGKKGIVVVLVVIIIAAAAAFFFYQNGIKAVSDKSNKVTVEIPAGSGAYDILAALDKAGLVKNMTCAKIYTKLSGPDNLQANTYVLNKNMSLSDILDIIGRGDVKYVFSTKFTIVEGATYKDAATAISKTTGIDENELIKTWSDKTYLKALIDKYWFLTDDILKEGILCPLEGYLYPETYYVTDSEPTAKSITDQILKITDSNLSKVKDDIDASDMSVHEFLTFASVVENESLFEKDQAKIAGVFMNRLKDDMPLQSDITVLYALGEKRVDVSIKDTSVDSPYNTYKHTGLPIGPVCSPYLKTIKSCLNYDKNDYLYFFATEDGTVIYSKTYAEHQKAIDENGWY